MRKRKPQPPIDRQARAEERHDFWPTMILVVVASACLVNGARRLTEIGTEMGSSATEPQLVFAFSRGGLEYVDAAPAPDFDAAGDPAAAAAALERLERWDARPQRMRYRVNTGAATPCPT
jgi:hypothetical protein